MSQKPNNNNEIITFETENINAPSNNNKSEINIDEILEKENRELKKYQKVKIIKTEKQNQKYSETKELNDIKKEKIINLDEKDEEINEPISQDIRDTSRRIYLNKRVNQQLELFKRRLIDEQNIFKDVKLTKEEINNNRLNSKIYNLINKSYNINNIKKDNDNRNNHSKKDKKESLENVD